MTIAAGVSRVAVVGDGAGASWAAQVLAKGLDGAVTDPGSRAEAGLHGFVILARTERSVPGLAPDASAVLLRFTANLEVACPGAEVVQEDAPQVARMRNIVAALGLEVALPGNARDR